MKRVVRIIAMLMVIVTLGCGFTIPAEAAQNSCIAIQGSAANYKKATTFTVSTGKNWGSNKIIFSQTKGEMHYGSDVRNYDCYGNYTITVKDHKTGKTTKYEWRNSPNSPTIRLKDNRTYTISIKPYQPKTVGNQNLSWWSLTRILGKIFGTYNKDYWSWNSAPTWRIKSTKAVNWCSVG